MRISLLLYSTFPHKNCLLVYFTIRVIVNMITAIKAKTKKPKEKNKEKYQVNFIDITLLSLLLTLSHIPDLTPSE